MISNNRIRLSVTPYTKRWVTGVVCSPNKSLDTKRTQKWVDATCEDTLKSLKTEDRGTHTVLCPQGC